MLTDGFSLGVPGRPRHRPDSASGHRASSIPDVPPALIAFVALTAALLVGRLVADGRVKYAAAIVVIAVYGSLVLFDLAAALGLWVAVLFFSGLRSLSIAPNAMGVLLLLGWIGAMLGGGRARSGLSHQRKLVVTMVLFALWLTFSTAWAGNPSRAAAGAFAWWLGVVAFAIAATWLVGPREARLTALAFIAGAVVSVLIGLAQGGLNSSAAVSTSTTSYGRFTGGGGDPNVQAAGYIAAMFVCAGMLSLCRTRLSRAAMLLAFVLVTVGFVATQSRGGLIALAVAAVAALVLLPRSRRRIVGLLMVAAFGVVVLAVAHPSALSRIVDVGGGSSGRSDLWTVAWRIFQAHPVTGVGLGNFQLVEQHFTLFPGQITSIYDIVDNPHLVHNVYLQLLTETGVVGLIGYLAFIGLSLRTTWRAAKLFDSQGLVGYGDLSRAVLTATIAMLTAMFFISAGDDLRLWVLLGFGPALLAMARHGPTTNAT